MSKDTVSYEDFQKIDIRIGEILSVEVVPDADKLLKFSVDVGENAPRTIVSGIREHVGEPSALVGMKTTFVLNLPPRIIRGITSEGMLFAVGLPAQAGGESGFSFLHPEGDVAPGSPLV